MNSYFSSVGGGAGVINIYALKIARLSMFILSVQRQLLSGMFRQPRMCQLYLVIRSEWGL